LKNKLATLFFSTLRISACTFGGGFVIVPLLRRKFVEDLGWVEDQEMLDLAAIAQSAPGPIAVNASVLVGYKVAGIPGALCATLGLVTPCIIVILLVARVLKAFGSNPVVQSVFYGLRPASAGLIAAALVGVAMMSLIQWDLFQSTGNVLDLVSIKGLILAVVIYFCTKKFKKIHPAAWLGLAAVVGIVFRFAGV